MSYYSQILGTGSYVPEQVLSNADLEKFIDTNDEWIRTRTGIHNRRIVSKDETTVTMSTKAAQRALEQAGLKGSDLDMIVVGTITPDTVMPTCGNQLQAILGATNAFSFDMQAACSGFAYGLSIADQFIRSGKVKHALVIGAETLSKVVDWSDRSTCILFGDAAGAAIVSRSEDPNHRILSTHLQSAGIYGDLLQIPHGYGKVPHFSPEFNYHLSKIQMKGAEVFKLAVRHMVETAERMLAENGMTASDVDFFIFHQANMRIIDYCAKTMKVEPHKMWNNLDKYGNVSAATLPLCLDEAVRAKAVKPGDVILMVTFGGGLTWGGTLLKL
jgi:3-oxoacyl-[acyl-carrier-protein] synthase III